MTQRQKPATLGTFLDLLARAFVPDLEIDVAPDQVYLQQGGQSLYLRPFVVLDASANEPRVLAVGEELSPTSATVRVDLFDPKSPTAPPERKFECLEAFFRFAIVKLRGRRAVLLRARVHVRGAERLSKVFGGYESVLLRQALLSAGARECIIHYAG
jgi:hypothetical protein